MKYYVEQKLFTFVDKFNIYGEYGEVVYTVEGEFFTIGKKYHVYDVNNQEVAYIEQVVFSFLPRFSIFVDGENVGQIVREFTFFTHKYHIEGSTWNITGDFLGHDYDITSENETVASINKEWLTIKDQYEIDIADQYNPVIVIATVLAIDACIAAAAADANSAH